MYAWNRGDGDNKQEEENWPVWTETALAWQAIVIGQGTDTPQATSRSCDTEAAQNAGVTNARRIDADWDVCGSVVVMSTDLPRVKRRQEQVVLLRAALVILVFPNKLLSGWPGLFINFLQGGPGFGGVQANAASQRQSFKDHQARVHFDILR